MSEHERSVGETSEWCRRKSIFDALDLTFNLDPASHGPGCCYVPAKISVLSESGMSQLIVAANGEIAEWLLDHRAGRALPHR
jgi:hypothetical protein